MTATKTEARLAWYPRQFWVHFLALVGLSVTRQVAGWIPGLATYFGILGIVALLGTVRGRRTRDPDAADEPNAPVVQATKPKQLPVPGCCRWCGLRPRAAICGGRSDGGTCEPAEAAAANPA